MSRDRHANSAPEFAIITGPHEEPGRGQWSRVLFLGDEAPRRAFAHALLARLAAAHAPDELVVALCVSPERRASWAWTRWLPHTLHDTAEFLDGRPQFEPGVRASRTEPLAVVVLDGAGRTAGLDGRNTVVLDLDARRRRPGRTTLRLDAGAAGVRATWVGPDRRERSAPLDDATAAAALLAPHARPPGRRITAALDAAGDGHPEIWPPPPAGPPTIDHLLPPLVPTRDRGLTTASYDGGPLTVPAGVLDRPFEPLPDVLSVDLSGHLLVTGPPGSGRSTLVTTLVIALALTHSPDELQVYCLDPGGALAPLAGLPHVGAVASDRETAAATVAKVTALLDRREPLAAERAVAARGDVFLVVDREDAEHAAALDRIAAAGTRHGVHLIVTSEHPDSYSLGAELRLDGPRPGTGTADGASFVTALPRLDGVESAQDLPDAVAALAAEVAEQWGERPGAPGVRALPSVVPASTLPEPQGRLRVTLGLNEGELAPVTHDFAAAPHLVVLGAEGSGRTNLLRLVARSITETHSPVEARILVVDYRGGLGHTMPEDFVLGHAFSDGVLEELIEGTARAIGERLAPPASGTTARRAARAWQGPRLFILVDDYEQVRGPAYGPLDPLLEHLPLGYELGAHLVIAGSAEGAAGDPLLAGLYDAGAGVVRLAHSPGAGQVPPGRARYRAGGETTLVQTALAD